MQVFISYGSAVDQVTALRLQALGAVNGLNVYVPPAYTRQQRQTTLDSEVSQQLTSSDVILGVVGGVGLMEACRQELDASIRLGKNTMIMADQLVAPQLAPFFGANLVVLDPANPQGAEGAIVHQLLAMKAEENSKKALLALGTLALGLLIFADVYQEQPG